MRQRAERRQHTENGAAGNGVAAAVHAEAEAYRNGEDRPLGAYVLVMAVFAAMVAGAAGLARLSRRQLPDSVGPWDVLLLAAGTHKLSRTITKNSVTAPLRAPFTRYTGRGGPAEVMEEVRATTGLRHSIGELLTCPFCLDVWIATGFAIGLVFAPRATRLVAATFSVLTGSDLLHLAYAMAQQAAEG
ncbi:MAG: hypothetical protein QOI36_616 [Pseudonocardiales bacterium]|jgi:hypothetical protein|nr:hypothetical protein [Pseudonocardia sp.]MDT7649210.1 hypothetical protein [Pseudonocardiales bacterium]